MHLKPKVKPGFVRVLVKDKNKTIRIREHHAKDPNYMIRHGLVKLEEPEQPQLTHDNTAALLQEIERLKNLVPSAPAPVTPPPPSTLADKYPATPVIQSDTEPVQTIKRKPNGSKGNS